VNNWKVESYQLKGSGTGWGDYGYFYVDAAFSWVCGLAAAVGQAPRAGRANGFGWWKLYNQFRFDYEAGSTYRAVVEEGEAVYSFNFANVGASEALRWVVACRQKGFIWLDKVGLAGKWKIKYMLDGFLAGSPGNPKMIAAGGAEGSTYAASFADLRVFGLGEPWKTQYGLASTHEAEYVAETVCTAGSADMLIEFTWVSPVNDGVVEVNFRREDGNNTLRLECDQVAHTMTLYEVTGGVETEVEQVSAWFGENSYILIRTEGTRVDAALNGEHKILQTGVSAHASGLGVCASVDVENLAIYEVELSGAALAELEAYLE
jgi:hypothetical protein